MFFDPDDMEKFADEGTMDDDLEGESRSRGSNFREHTSGIAGGLKILNDAVCIPG